MNALLAPLRRLMPAGPDEGRLLSRDLYHRGDAIGLERLAEALDIEPRDKWHADGAADFSYLVEERPHMRWGEMVGGDFTHYVDLTLWNMRRFELETVLRRLALDGRLFAMPDERVGVNPFPFWLYRKGRRHDIDVVFDPDDEEGDRPRIGPPSNPPRGRLARWR